MRKYYAFAAMLWGVGALVLFARAPWDWTFAFPRGLVGIAALITAGLLWRRPAWGPGAWLVTSALVVLGGLAPLAVGISADRLMILAGLIAAPGFLALRADLRGYWDR